MAEYDKIRINTMEEAAAGIIDAGRITPKKLAHAIRERAQAKLVPGANITIDNTDPDAPVISATGGGGGGAAFANIVGAGGASTSAQATKGRSILPVIPITISKVIQNFITVSGATYVTSIGRLSGSIIDEVTSVSAPIVASSAGVSTLVFDVAASLLANREYLIALTRTDSTGTYALPSPFSASGSYSWNGAPSYTATKSFSLAQNTPLTLSQAISFGGGAALSGDIIYSL